MAGVPQGQYQMTQMRGQPAINNYFQGGAGGANGKPAGQPEAEKRPDDDSRKGRFGWCEFEKNHIPYIFRSGGEKYTSVRMVERKLLDKFLRILPSELYNNSCYCIKSYYITDIESKLLNEINLKHSDCHFGKEAFTSKDMVVRLSDSKEFYRFLDLCYKKLVLKKSNATDRIGFFRINGESVVPYTVKDTVKYVPLFYFEGETDHLKLKSDSVDSWDLAYLKFCCKVQGIRNELFAADTCRVVALEEIKGHFPSGTTFEDYWPAKGSIEPVHHSQRVSAGNWTQKPVSVVPQNQQPNQPPPPAHGNNRASYNNSQHSAAMAASCAQQMNTAAVAAAQRTYIESLQRSQLAQAAQAAQASQAAAAAAVQQQRMLAAAYASLPGNHMMGQPA